MITPEKNGAVQPIAVCLAAALAQAEDYDAAKLAEAVEFMDTYGTAGGRFDEDVHRQAKAAAAKIVALENELARRSRHIETLLDLVADRRG